MKKIRLLIADDHQVILEGLASLFSNVKDVEIVGTAKNGLQVLKFVEEEGVDVILLDVMMPVLNGVETCKKLKTKFPDIKVIALSMSDRHSYFKRMFQNGASGYLLKDDSSDEIENAIREVISGRKYVSSQLKKRLSSIEYLTREVNSIVDVSPREKEVLGLLSEGLTDMEIGEKLFISFHTVKTHRKKLLAKFAAKNTAELIKISMEKGFI